MIKSITKAYIRTYTDNQTTIAYVEWIDSAGETGRTEGTVGNTHMQTLMRRATAEGIKIESERW